MLALRWQSAPPYRQRRLFPGAGFPVGRAQEKLLDEIRAEAFATRRYTGRAAFDPRVLAALRRVPRHTFVPALIEQLKPGGTLVIPVGGAHESQELMVLDKDVQGRMHERSVLPVVFVPLTGTGDG